MTNLYEIQNRSLPLERQPPLGANIPLARIPQIAREILQEQHAEEQLFQRGSAAPIQLRVILVAQPPGGAPIK